jgi:hypothetical protein
LLYCLHQLRLPFYQFSEQAVDYYTLNGGTNPAYSFLTGHGGYLQVFTHGLTGYRFRADTFYLNPSLPPQLPDGVTVKGMKWHGAIFNVQIGLHTTSITRVAASTSADAQNATVQIASGNAMAGTYPLAVGGTLQVPTRRPDLNVTVVAGNLAQCKPVISSNTTTFPGQFPVAAVDSSNGTAWQPSLPSPAYLVVDLESQQNVSAVHINWGDAPARSFQVLVSNDSSTFNVTAVQMDVEISAPFDATLVAEVQIELGNTTTTNFASVLGRYAQMKNKLIADTSNS